ncbi:MAG TPA: hypothetical protein VEK15_20060, partial [Vicinamibacteria bacterium]|nr:hypothetical protein [Vicinamibacteria bacterium]
MHGFDGATGDEVFAYIPDDAMGLDLAGGEIPGSRHVLKDLVERLVAGNNGAINHKFFLSGPPIVNDAFLRSDFSGDDRWHTMLTFGRARGGRFVTGLDVTNPLNPLLRFNKGNREGISDPDSIDPTLTYDGLGETWSPPVMGNVFSDPLAGPTRIDQWVAFLGAGYGCNNANFEGHHLYALRVEDGSIYYRGQVSNNSSAAIPYNALVAMPTLYNPHQVDVADNKDYTTRVYIGDVQGNIWKLVTDQADPANWSLVKFAEVGLDQPITAAVAILADANNQQVYVMAGTGGDTRVDATTTDFKLVGYIDNDAEGANTAQYPLGSTPFWDQPLNPEERVYVTPVTIGQVGDTVPALVFFAGSKAEFDPNECNTGFTSTLYALGIESGLAEVDLDGTGGDDESVGLGEGKVTGIMARDGNLYVSESGGLGSSSDMKVFGDGKFDDELPAHGSFSVQVLVDSFRVSPF